MFTNSTRSLINDLKSTKILLNFKLKNLTTAQSSQNHKTVNLNISHTQNFQGNCLKDGAILKITPLKDQIMINDDTYLQS